MRKSLALALVVSTLAGLAACGGSSGSLKDQSRAAMPTKDAVAMGSPKASSIARQQGGSGIQQDSIARDDAAGTPSPWFGATVFFAANVNVGAAWVLDLIQAITQLEPTRCDATSCTWGPGSGPFDYNAFELVVTKNGDAFDYVLSAQPKSQPTGAFIPYLSGSATPGAQPHHGSGNFTIDFDAAARLDHPHGDVGKLAMTYTNVGPLQINATFTGVKDTDHSNTLNNVVYAYTNDATGGGDMALAVHNTTSDARFSLHSRWKNDGEGRGDVNGSGHDASSGNPYNVSVSECWATAPFNVVFFTSTAKSFVITGLAGPDSGDQAQCAYPTAAPVTTQAP